MRRGGLALAILGLVALASTWFLTQLETSLRAPPETGEPLLILDRFTATAMNEHGAREYEIRSPRLTQPPGEGETHIEAPNIRVFGAGERRQRTLAWHLRAGGAWVSADREVVRLEDRVVARRPAAAGRAPLVIRSPQMTYRPEQGLAQTDAAVSAETPGGVITGVGMRALLNEDRVELLSNVRGTYAQAKP